MRIAATLLALALVGCASPGLPVDVNLGSLGREDPSIVEGKVVSIDLNSGILYMDVRKVDGEAMFRNGARIEADENTMFYNSSRYDEIRHISQIPGTIVEIEGWNDHGIYRALSISLVDVPPDHPVWRPGRANQ
jgi:hypothetical protein